MADRTKFPRYCYFASALAVILCAAYGAGQFAIAVVGLDVEWQATFATIAFTAALLMVDRE